MQLNLIPIPALSSRWAEARLDVARIYGTTGNVRILLQVLLLVLVAGLLVPVSR